MKFLRIFLSTLLLIENLVIPITGVFAATTEIPIVEISYQTDDLYTPQASEYVAKINASKPSYQTTPYSYYTLSGIVKTVKAMPKTANEVLATNPQLLSNVSGSNLLAAATPQDQNQASGLNYDTTGEGVPGYLIVAYDRITSTSLSYVDWIAATMSNAKGKFALPIEKTRSGVYIVVLKPTNEGFRFITSYDVSSNFLDRATKYPELGLNIGVTEKIESPKTLDQDTIDSIPNSVSIIDRKDYWDCGGSVQSAYKYKSPYHTRTADFKVKATDSSYVGNKLTAVEVQCMLDGNQPSECSPNVPPAQESPYVDPNGIEGRNDRLAYKNYTSTMSSLNTYTGTLNAKQPFKGQVVLPNCAEFLKSEKIKTGDSNKNYYTYNGLSLLTLPKTVDLKLKDQVISEDILKNTYACSDGSAKKTYYDLKLEGHQEIIQNFLQSEDFSKTYTSRKYQDRIENDNVLNVCPEGDADCKSKYKAQPGETEYSRADVFEADSTTQRGYALAALDSTQVRPKENEKNVLYSNYLTEDAPYKQLEVPYTPKVDNYAQIYEIGPLRSLCEITEVKKGGTKIIKNEERTTRLGDTDPVAAGFKLTNYALQEGAAVPAPASGEFYKGEIKYSIANFISGLVSIFQGWFSSGNSTDITTCVDGITTNPTTGVYETNPTATYTYGCSGNVNYTIKAVAEQVDADAITETESVKNATTQKQSIENIRDGFRVPTGRLGDKPLAIAKATVEIFEATNTVSPARLYIDIDTTEASTDSTDSMRFNVRIPDGTGGGALAYSKAAVRLIDRTKIKDDQTNFYAGGSSVGGGGGTTVNVNATCAPVSTMTSYKQCDSQWGSISWGTGTCGNTVCNSGCGPTSVSMVVNLLKPINPGQIVTDSAYPYRTLSWCKSSYLEDNANAFRVAGLSENILETCTSQDIADALCGGNLVMVLGATCINQECTAKGNHFLIVTGVVDNGENDYFTVLDPYYDKTTQKFNNIPDGPGTMVHYIEENFDGYSCIMVTPPSNK